MASLGFCPYDTMHKQNNFREERLILAQSFRSFSPAGRGWVSSSSRDGDKSRGRVGGDAPSSVPEAPEAQRPFLLSLPLGKKLWRSSLTGRQLSANRFRDSSSWSAASGTHWGHDLHCKGSTKQSERTKQQTRDKTYLAEACLK